MYGAGGSAARSPRRGSIDLVRTASLARGGGLPFRPAVAALAVAAEGERRLDLELALEAGPPLIPTLLILELLLVERRRLFDAVRQTKLDRQVGRLAAHRVPRRAECELVGDGPDAFFFSSRRRHTRSYGDWSSDVCSSD